MVIVESSFLRDILTGWLSLVAGEGLTRTRLALPNTSCTAVLAVVLVTVVHDSFRIC